MVVETAAKRAEANRINFTAFALKTLPIPEARDNGSGQPIVAQKDYWDSTVRGFGIRISSTGTKTWVMFARMPKNGRNVLKRFSLGRHSERDGDGGLTLAEARRKADEYKLAIKRGEDPTLVKETAAQETLRRSAHTFGKVVEEFLRTGYSVKTKGKLRPRTIKRYTVDLLGPDLAPWRNRPIASITRKDVLEALRNMEAHMGAGCNRALTALRVLFAWGIQRGMLEVSPTDYVKEIAPETSRDRHLYGDVEHNRPSEIALLWNACTEIAGPFGNIAKLLLLTGQRRDEVTGMKHDELIELDGKHPRWSLSPERTKTGKRHLVPLSPTAVKIIKRTSAEIKKAMPHVATSEYVFTTKGTTPFSGFSKLKKSIDGKIAELKEENPAKYKRQFVEKWTLHDLRRTCKTAWADLGIPSDVRDALLNHAKPGMDRIYDHSQRAAEKRTAMVKWEQYIVGLIKTDEGKRGKRK